MLVSYPSSASQDQLRPEQGQSPGPSKQSHINQTAINSHNTLSRQAKRMPVLLVTVLVRLCTAQGIELNARALLDQGSEISFVSKSLVQQLHIS